MKNYIARNLDPETFVETDVEFNIPQNVFDCLWNSVENLPLDLSNGKSSKSIPQCNADNGSVSFSFKSDGRWFQINIIPLK